MTTTRLATAVILLLLAAPLAADAQPARKVYRIGLILTATPNKAGHLIKALNEGLRELGYVEGRNVVFERHGLGETSPGSPTIPPPKSSGRIWSS